MVFNLIKLKAGDNSFTVDGIPIITDDKVKVRAETATIAADKAELYRNNRYRKFKFGYVYIIWNYNIVFNFFFL